MNQSNAVMAVREHSDNEVQEVEAQTGLDLLTFTQWLLECEQQPA